MYRRDTSPPAHFSVHAEFTISHPGADDPRNRPRTSTERDEATGGVRMTYTWQPEWTGRAHSEDRASEGGGAKQDTFPTSTSNSNKSIYSDTASSATLTPPRTIPSHIVSPSTAFGTPYTRGYQKGNIFFTSTPPSKDSVDIGDNTTAGNIPKDPRLNLMMHETPGRGGLIHDSSGYGSDMLSPNSQTGSLPRRVQQPYDRKCRSTCNITLSTNLTGSQDPVSQCGRTQSLRCQTSSSSVLRNTLNPPRFYGCGDPWCHHLRQTDDFAPLGRISPVPEESTPLSTNLPSRSNTYTVADRTNNKKDASVQTFEMVDKCTSPFLRMNSTDSVDSRSVRKYQRRGLTEPIRKNYSPGGSFTPDSLDSVKPSRRLTRSPKLRRLPAFDHSKEPIKEQSPADSKTSDSLKKPRTVHIDVYCTGTEMESNASDNSSDDGSESKSASTPQTVFENEKMRVTHRKADDKDLPFYLKNTFKQKDESKPLIKSFETNTSVEREESDDENASTAYPSKMSSSSTIGDYSASMSSVPRSWTTYSMSSCAIPEDYDSIANTSWKDTFSDIDSLLHSRSSIAPTESLDFVPRRLYQTNQSIDEAPEYLNDRKDLLETPSVASIQPSDSFEYANSEDRFRIKQMEEMWKNKGVTKSYPSPINEKTLQIQQKRMQEYMEKKIRDRSKWNSKDSDSNDSDDSGKGWTFTKRPQKQETIDKRLINKEKGLPKVVKDDQKEEPTIAVPQERSPVRMLPNTVRNAFLKSVSPQKTVPPSDKSFFGKQSSEPFSTPSNRFTVSASEESSFMNKGASTETQQMPFIKNNAALVTDDVVKKSEKPLMQNEPLSETPAPRKRPVPLKKPPSKETLQEQGSLSDSSPTSRSPSFITLKQRLSLDPNIRSPFMLIPGVYTEPRSIARKFGTVVSVMKKPGHHIGPAKNPDCLCDHCQNYWESFGPRSRTRSMGDPPSGKYVQNWKEFLEGNDSGKEKIPEKLPFSDF